MLKTLVVIPAYNQALNIKKTVIDLKNNAPDVDYVVVNDGSKDNVCTHLITLGIFQASSGGILGH